MIVISDSEDESQSCIVISPPHTISPTPVSDFPLFVLAPDTQITPDFHPLQTQHPIVVELDSVPDVVEVLPTQSKTSVLAPDTPPSVICDSNSGDTTTKRETTLPNNIFTISDDPVIVTRHAAQQPSGDESQLSEVFSQREHNHNFKNHQNKRRRISTKPIVGQGHANKSTSLQSVAHQLLRPNSKNIDENLPHKPIAPQLTISFPQRQEIQSSVAKQPTPNVNVVNEQHEGFHPHFTSLRDPAIVRSNIDYQKQFPTKRV